MLIACKQQKLPVVEKSNKKCHKYYLFSRSNWECSLLKAFRSFSKQPFTLGCVIQNLNVPKVINAYSSMLKVAVFRPSEIKFPLLSESRKNLSKKQIKNSVIKICRQIFQKVWPNICQKNLSQNPSKNLSKNIKKYLSKICPKNLSKKIWPKNLTKKSVEKSVQNVCVKLSKNLSKINRHTILLELN